MCPRKRKTNKQLPERVYFKHNAYYYVDTSNKWHRLGKNFSEAIQAWVEIIESPQDIVSMNDLFDRYMLEVSPLKAEATYKSNLQEVKNLRKVFGAMQPHHVKPVHVYKFLDARSKQASTTPNREKSLLSAVFNYAIRWGVVETNPCQGVKRLTEKSRDRYISDEEFAAVKRIALPLMAIIMDFAYFTGLRQTDVLNLKMSALKEDGILVEISKTKNTTKKTILILWSTELKALIDKTNQILPENREFLFERIRGGGKYTSSGFQTAWQRLMTKAIKGGHLSEKFTFKDIRRKTATDVENMHSREVARRLLGHADQKTTAIYISGVQQVSPLR